MKMKIGRIVVQLNYQTTAGWASEIKAGPARNPPTRNETKRKMRSM
jgi:hypothetical protein